MGIASHRSANDALRRIDSHHSNGGGIDGDLSDEGWRSATRIDKWYETNPGDNVEPKVRNVGYPTYDDKFFYAGFEFEDPDLAAIRALFADRDNIGNGFNDYGGILIDSRNTGRTATFFVALDDVTGAPLVEDGVKPHVGLDVKHTPNADNAGQPPDRTGSRDGRTMERVHAVPLHRRGHPRR